ESARVAAARARAAQRVRRQRDVLRPFGIAAIAVVAAAAAGGRPAAGLHGTGLGVTVALIAFALALAVSIRDDFAERSQAVQAAVIAAMGAAGVALAALQPRGAIGLAARAAVWLGVVRLRLPLGAALAAATTLAVDLAAGLAGDSSAAVVAVTLLC